jgi:hypothetical protein
MSLDWKTGPNKANLHLIKHGRATGPWIKPLKIKIKINKNKNV